MGSIESHLEYHSTSLTCGQVLHRWAPTVCDLNSPACIAICNIGWGSFMPPQPMQQPANPHPIFSNRRLPWPMHALHLGGMRAFCAAQVSCLLEALGMGYFFLMTMDLSPTPQSSIYAPCPGGIGRGLLPQTIIDFPPTPQSSICRFSAGDIGRGLLLLTLLDSNPCRVSPGRRRHPHTHPAILHFFFSLA